MASKKPQKKKRSPRKFTGFYKSNGKQTTQKSLYDQALVGSNPEGRATNYGY